MRAKGEFRNRSGSRAFGERFVAFMLLAAPVLVCCFLTASLLPHSDPCLGASRLRPEIHVVYRETTPGGLQFVERRSIPEFAERADRVASRKKVDNDFLRPRSILYAITSAPAEVGVRAVIRNTWATRITAPSRLLFFIGRPADNAGLEGLEREMKRTGDLVILWNVQDTYNNLTMKTIALFEYAKLHSEEDFILKADTNVYVKPWRLHQVLDEVNDDSRVYLGAIKYYGERNSPSRSDDGDPRWRLSYEDYPDPLFPPYYSGFSYLVSRDMAEPLSDCLPKDFSCTASLYEGHPGGSFSSCELESSCWFTPLRHEDASVGGILFSHLMNRKLRTNCKPGIEGAKCRRFVDNGYKRHVKNYASKFVDYPWARSPEGFFWACTDGFASIHHMNVTQIQRYFDGGEGNYTKMCSLAPDMPLLLP